MSKYYPKPYKQFGRGIEVKHDLSNYATKSDIKNISHVDTSSFALKTNLANLKTEVDKLDIDKLVPVPVDLSKLSDVVKNDVVEKDVHNKLVTKVDNIDTSGFVLKTKYDIDKSELENKIPDTNGFVKKTDYNSKITELENKIPDINNLPLIIAHANGYIEEKGVNKYLVFDSKDENKDLLKKYNDVFNGIRDKIKEISIGELDHEKDYMIIKFNSDDNLPLNKPLKFHNMTITVRSVFEEDGKLYPQVFLDDILYELNV